MCDFRGPPKIVVRVCDNKLVSSTYNGCAIGYSIAEKDKLDKVIMGKVDDNYSIGIYHVVATGGYYAYYDGSGWYRSGNVYEFSDYGPEVFPLSDFVDYIFPTRFHSS